MSVESVLSFKVDPPLWVHYWDLKKCLMNGVFPLNEDNKFKGYLVDAQFGYIVGARKSFPLI